MWVCPPTAVIIFGLRDPTIIGSRPDTKKLLFAATRFQFKESIKGASSADRPLMLQTNETNARKNALKNRFFYKTAPINKGQSPRNKYLVWDRKWVNLLFFTSLPFGPRLPFWTASCPSKLLFFLKGFILRSTNTLFAVLPSCLFPSTSVTPGIPL